MSCGLTIDTATWHQHIRQVYLSCRKFRNCRSPLSQTSVKIQRYCLLNSVWISTFSYETDNVTMKLTRISQRCRLRSDITTTVGRLKRKKWKQESCASQLTEVEVHSCKSLDDYRESVKMYFRQNHAHTRMERSCMNDVTSTSKDYSIRRRNVSQSKKPRSYVCAMSMQLGKRNEWQWSNETTCRRRNSRASLGWDSYPWVWTFTMTIDWNTSPTDWDVRQEST